MRNAMEGIAQDLCLLRTFSFALVIIYLALAAQFESFRAPIIILISVPMAISGALLFINLGVGGATLNIYAEVGPVYTKTEATRRVPIHPTLLAVLRTWHRAGWGALVGRDPEPSDLIVPAPKTKRGHAGRQLTKSMIYKAWRRDVDALDIQGRRFHDLRRTFISLSLADGARREVLERITHQALATRAIDLYTTLPWETLCAEILRLDFPLEAPKVRAQPGHTALYGVDFMNQIVEAPGVEDLAGNNDDEPLQRFSNPMSRGVPPRTSHFRPVWQQRGSSILAPGIAAGRSEILLPWVLLGKTPYVVSWCWREAAPGPFP